MGQVSRRTVIRCCRARHAMRSHLPITGDSASPGFAADDMAVARGARAESVYRRDLRWRAGELEAAGAQLRPSRKG
eukprot:4343536-Heterocapsa_arctica.AAC.1